jgi:RNA polymerase subunit RPABC4/transcription elongation factor Spt4
MVLMGSGILLLGVLVAAIILTRRTLADGERETYEMCPACDGEIEGDEETCPYCDFQLSGGYGRFHDCKECDGSIPSSMDHCPLCGAAQDITEFYEKREQKEIVEEDIEDIAEDDDEIVSGSLDFEERVKDFGVSDAALESDWDDRLGEAETELDDFADQRALSAVEAESEEGADQVATTHLKESIETDSRGIDDFLGEKGKRRSLSDAEVEFSASDASIRADLFEITGEVGVLPGQEVIAEEIIDPTIVNEELPTDAKSDFTSLDDDAGHTEGLAEAILAAEQAAEPLVTDQSKEEDLPKKRRSIRRRKNGDGGSGGNSARGDSANADNASNSAPSDDDSGAEDSAVEDSDAEDSGAQDSAVEDSDAEESPKSD